MIGRNYDRALRLMQRATAMPPRKVQYYDKVWTLYLLYTNNVNSAWAIV